MIGETKRARYAVYGIVGLFLIVSWVPLYWVIRTSLLTNTAATAADTPLIVIPFVTDGFTLSAYNQIWARYPFETWFGNSIIVSLSATVIAVTMAIPGAYGFARLDFPGRKLLFYTVVITLMFPAIVLTIPVYDIFYQLGLIDSTIGIIIALAIFVQPLTIWLLQGFFRDIPENIEEAARIDGMGRFETFVRIILPLSRPAIAVTALFAFLDGWNNFLWVYLLGQSQGNYTAVVAVHYIMASDVLRDWNTLMAAVTVLIIPPIVFYGLSQRYVGEGLGGLV